MDINLFKTKLFNEAKKQGFSDYELYYSNSISTSVSILKGGVEKFSDATNGGVSFRGIYKDNIGYSYTEKIEESEIYFLIKQALENSKIMDISKKEHIYIGDKVYPKLATYYENIENISADNMINTALSLEKSILSYSDMIKSCNYCMVSKSIKETYMANSKGINLKNKNGYIVIYASAVAKHSDSIQSNGDAKLSFGNEYNKINIAKFGEDIAKNCIASLGAVSLPSQKYDIIFENECFTDLMSCFLGSFFGETVQEGLSLLKDKINKKIAASVITIIDDPLMENQVASKSFDAEGVATYKKVVVENGILKTYLHNLKSAKKDNVKSTGNAYRAGYKGSISTSTTNFFIQKGNSSIDKLIEKMNNGIYITDLSGLHAGVNAISGDFSLLSSGFMVENGKKTYPVEQITVSGNFYNLLENIEDISSDIKFSLSGIGSPSILIRSLSISGE